MSNCIDVSSEQLCYIPCNFCNIVLAVSVPCSCLFETVTVRCGHCSNLWSVNMAAAFQYSLSNSATPSFLWQDVPPQPQSQPQPQLQANSYGTNLNHRSDNASSSRYYPNKKIGARTAPTYTNDTNSVAERVVNPPPEKRQRVPSAYNRFIKEEIQRIKASNPDITHREAFSTAAKNWAHFPHIHFGLMLETDKQPNLNEGHDKRLLARTALLNN